MRKKSEKKIYSRTVSNVCYMVRYLIKYVPEYIFIKSGQLIFSVFWNLVLNVWFIKYLFEAIENKSNFSEVLFVVVFITVFKLVFDFINKCFDKFYYPQAHLKLHEKMQSDLYIKARSLDLACYDDPEFYDEYIWAMRESDGRVIRITSDVIGFLECLLTTIGMLIMFMSIDWIVIIVVLISTFLSLYIKNKLNKANYQKRIDMNPISRKLDYINRVFYLNDYAKELRTGNVGEILANKFDAVTDEKIECVKRHAPKILKLSLALQLITGYMFDVSVTGYLIIRYAVDPTFSLGGFSASINVIWKLFVQINQMTNYVAGFKEHSIYAEKFRKFIENEPKITSGKEVAMEFESLSLKNVSFSYDDNFAIKDITLTINKGEKIAFVGYNGAGKTTLVKLLLRLYDATDGCVLYNGKDIKDYDIDSYRAQIGTIFQDYKLFAATIGENVLGDECTEENKVDILSALNMATFDKINSLPNGVDTILTREFDPNGVNLSGGEAQKIAIARAFAKSHDFIIMDEFSSALDPIAEYELNKSICTESENKTMVFISHRLSTTRMVDKIYMLSNGRIIEQGSHDELIKMNGEYARLFMIQAERYAES